jgi:hypothetical protein
MKAIFVKTCGECSNCIPRFNDEFPPDDDEDLKLSEMICLADGEAVPDKIIDKFKIRKDCPLPDVNV